MTKRNLLLVSLFLVFGLVGMTATALAQTQWTVGANENDFGRHQGLTEATGQVSMTNVSWGTVGATTLFKLYYSAPVSSLGTVSVICSGNSTSPWYLAPNCNGWLTTSLDPTKMILTVEFNTTVVFPFGSSSQISITARVNATTVTCPGQVTVYVDAHTPTGIPNLTITPFQPSSVLRILEVNCDPSLSLTLGTQHGQIETEPAFALTCIGVKDGVGPYTNDFTLNVDEEFPNALTSESFEQLLDPGVGTGTVTNGTSVDLVFYNVPQGVGIKEEEIKPCSTLWTGNPLYCAGGTLNIALVGSDTGTSSPDTGTPPTHTVTFIFETISEDAGTAETIDIKFKFWSHGPLPAGEPQTTVNLEKDPYPPPSTNVPLFLANDWELTTPLSVIEWTDCKTVLLYTWLTDQYGWDAGVEVSNTSLDPGYMGQPLYGDPLFGGPGSPGSAVPQTGPCTWYVYGGGVLITTVTSPPLLPGSTFAWDYAGQAPNSSAYAIAVCDFQNAHGYAILYYNFLGYDGVAADYLADVLPIPGLYHRSPAGDTLGETAVAPYLINKWLEKLLNYGLHH